MSSSKPKRTGWRAWLIGNYAKETQADKGLRAARVQTREEVLAEYKLRMGFGVLLMAGGVGVSLGTFLFASAGGVGYVFWGGSGFWGYPIFSKSKQLAGGPLSNNRRP